MTSKQKILNSETKAGTKNDIKKNIKINNQFVFPDKLNQNKNEILKNYINSFNNNKNSKNGHGDCNFMNSDIPKNELPEKTKMELKFAKIRGISIKNKQQNPQNNTNKINLPIIFEKHIFVNENSKTDKTSINKQNDLKLPEKISLNDNLNLKINEIKKTDSPITSLANTKSSSDEVNFSFEEDNTTEEISDISDIYSKLLPTNGKSWPLRPSLFPHVPPYIRFNTHDATTPFKLPKGRRHLKWKLSSIVLPPLIKRIVLNTGFKLIYNSDEWSGTWNRLLKSSLYKEVKGYQKMNHFPGAYQVGRKDRLWRNFQKLIEKYGRKEFSFIPLTYVLPKDMDILKKRWEKKSKDSKEKWITKPTALSRGMGIKIVNCCSQLPLNSPLIVQKYISSPYLINGNKFDLRLYVLITSFNPLRIYLYLDGLVRFACAKYTKDISHMQDKYVHLTNYSINKYSSMYTTNRDANLCKGHKWTILKLWEFMEKRGINTKSIWKNLKELVIKTIISAESSISQLCKENLSSRYTCYELFGIDVLLDETLKAWLLEVNISPSLYCPTPLDSHVKGPLMKTLFDIVQFHLPQGLVKVDSKVECYEPKIYSNGLTEREVTKQNYFCGIHQREEYLEYILNDLTGDDIRHLVQAEDELAVKGQFERIFPTSHTYTYFKFMEPRYYNRLYDAWENKYHNNKKSGIKILQNLCAHKLHLRMISSNNEIKPDSADKNENRSVNT